MDEKAECCPKIQKEVERKKDDNDDGDDKEKNGGRKKKKDTSCSWRSGPANFSLAWQETQILSISLECVPVSINPTHNCLSTDTSWRCILLNHILLVK